MWWEQLWATIIFIQVYFIWVLILFEIQRVSLLMSNGIRHMILLLFAANFIFYSCLKFNFLIIFLLRHLLNRIHYLFNCLRGLNFLRYTQILRFIVHMALMRMSSHYMIPFVSVISEWFWANATAVRSFTSMFPLMDWNRVWIWIRLIAANCFISHKIRIEMRNCHARYRVN